MAMGNYYKQLVVYIPALIIIFILAIVPFHTFLTVWISLLTGHYTLLRVWIEVLLVISLCAASYIYITDKKIRELFYKSRLIQLIILFLLIELICGAVGHINRDINTKSLLYGWLFDTRFLIFFLVTILISKKTSLIENKSLKLVLYPACLVVLFGLMQVLVLPKDFLTHFGYGPNTVLPYQTINHNSHYIRIFSTLRSPNSLGVYLIIPLSLSTVLLIKGLKVWQNAIFILLGTIVMVFSFSRSAWLGLVAAFAISVFLSIKDTVIKTRMLYVAVIIGMLFCLVVIVGRHSSKVQNIVFHTETHSKVKEATDQQHGLAIASDFRQLVKYPLGRGPGSSGPASIYNNKIQRSPEDFYIQIGEETGLIGLFVFLAINVYIILSLWARRQDSLSLALLASFIGLIICNALLPTWRDTTLAYLWWGLAGVVIATKPRRASFEKSESII